MQDDKGRKPNTKMIFKQFSSWKKDDVYPHRPLSPLFCFNILGKKKKKKKSLKAFFLLLPHCSKHSNLKQKISGNGYNSEQSSF